MFGTNEHFIMRDGNIAHFGIPEGLSIDAVSEKLHLYRRRVWSETPYMGRCSEDIKWCSVSHIRDTLVDTINNQQKIHTLCWVDGEIVGECTIEFFVWHLCKHRARMEISVRSDYWGLGIGSKMMSKLLFYADTRPYVEQVELGCVETNTRARALYERFGFRLSSVMPNALRFDDGRCLDEYIMICRLNR